MGAEVGSNKIDSEKWKFACLEITLRCFEKQLFEQQRDQRE